MWAAMKCKWKIGNKSGKIGREKKIGKSKSGKVKLIEFRNVLKSDPNHGNNGRPKVLKNIGFTPLWYLPALSKYKVKLNSL